MTTHRWVLALVEIIYFGTAAIPLTYVVWKHRSTGLRGWLFLGLFIVLQITGSGMILGAGQDGTPSATAIIIVQVGLSPLIFGLAGIIHEYSELADLEREQAR